MTKNTKKIDTALVGCGYWGTNIAKSLIPIKEAIYVFDVNKNNTKNSPKTSLKNLEKLIDIKKSIRSPNNLSMDIARLRISSCL